MQSAALQPNCIHSTVTASVLESTRMSDSSFEGRIYQDQLNQEEHLRPFAPAWQSVQQPPTDLKPTTAPSNQSINSQFDVLPPKGSETAANRSSSSDDRRRASNPAVENVLQQHLLKQQQSDHLLQTDILQTRIGETGFDSCLDQRLDQSSSTISTNPFLNANSSLPLCETALITQQVESNQQLDHSKNCNYSNSYVTLNTDSDLNLLNQKPKDPFNFCTCISQQFHSQTNKLSSCSHHNLSVSPVTQLPLSTFKTTCFSNSSSLLKPDCYSSFRYFLSDKSNYDYTATSSIAKTVCDQPRSYSESNLSVPIDTLLAEKLTKPSRFSSSNRQISVVHIGCCSSNVVVCNGRPIRPFADSSTCSQQLIEQNRKDASSGHQQLTPATFVSAVKFPKSQPLNVSLGLQSADHSLATIDNNSNKMFETETLNNGCQIPYSPGSVLQQSVSDNAAITETLQVFREPGERLGMALKFEGGSCASERIERVFIQSVADHSPASRVRSDRLDQLRENDELLEIDGHPVQCMSRLQCVSCLKDASTCIQLTVRRHPTRKSNVSFFGTCTTTPLISFAPVKPSTLIKPPSQQPPSVLSTQKEQMPLVVQSMHGHSSGSNMSRISGLGSATDINIENGMRTIRRFKGPPPCIPPRLSTTVLTSRPPSDSPPPLKQQLFVDDLENVQSNTIYPAELTETSSLQQSIHKPPNVPRRPSQPPPLPPRKLEPARLKLDLNNSLLTNKSDANHSAENSPHDELPLIGKSDTQVEAVHTQSSIVSLSNSVAFVSDSSNHKPNPSEAEVVPLQIAFNTAPALIQSATNLPTNALPLLNACTPAEHCMDSLNSISTCIESESDDTASTASTVIEKFSRASTANSSFSDKITNGDYASSTSSSSVTGSTLLDIDHVLGPFEQLEKELDSAAMMLGQYSPYMAGNVWSSLKSSDGESTNGTSIAITTTSAPISNEFVAKANHKYVLRQSNHAVDLRKPVESVNLDDYDDIQTVDCQSQNDYDPVTPGGLSYLSTHQTLKEIVAKRPQVTTMTTVVKESINKQQMNVGVKIEFESADNKTDVNVCALKRTISDELKKETNLPSLLPRANESSLPSPPEVDQNKTNTSQTSPQNSSQAQIKLLRATDGCAEQQMPAVIESREPDWVATTGAKEKTNMFHLPKTKMNHKLTIDDDDDDDKSIKTGNLVVKDDDNTLDKIESEPHLSENSESERSINNKRNNKNVCLSPNEEKVRHQKIIPNRSSNSSSYEVDTIETTIKTRTPSQNDTIAVESVALTNVAGIVPVAISNDSREKVELPQRSASNPVRTVSKTNIRDFQSNNSTLVNSSKARRSHSASARSNSCVALTSQQTATKSESRSRRPFSSFTGAQTLTCNSFSNQATTKDNPRTRSSSSSSSSPSSLVKVHQTLTSTRRQRRATALSGCGSDCKSTPNLDRMNNSSNTIQTNSHTITPTSNNVRLTTKTVISNSCSNVHRNGSSSSSRSQQSVALKATTADELTRGAYEEDSIGNQNNGLHCWSSSLVSSESRRSSQSSSSHESSNDRSLNHSINNSSAINSLIPKISELSRANQTAVSHQRKCRSSLSLSTSCMNTSVTSSFDGDRNHPSLIPRPIYRFGRKNSLPSTNDQTMISTDSSASNHDNNLVKKINNCSKIDDSGIFFEMDLSAKHKTNHYHDVLQRNCCDSAVNSAESSSSGAASNDSCAGSSSGENTSCDEQMPEPKLVPLSISDSGRSLSSASIEELSSDGESRAVIHDRRSNASSSTSSTSSYRRAVQQFEAAALQAINGNLDQSKTIVSSMCVGRSNRMMVRQKHAYLADSDARWAGGLKEVVCNNVAEDSLSNNSEISIAEQFRHCIAFSSCEFQAKTLTDCNGTVNLSTETGAGSSSGHSSSGSEIQDDTALDACRRNFRAIVEQWKQRASSSANSGCSPSLDPLSKYRKSRSVAHFSSSFDTDADCSSEHSSSRLDLNSPSPSVQQHCSPPPPLPPRPKSLLLISSTNALNLVSNRLSVDHLNFLEQGDLNQSNGSSELMSGHTSPSNATQMDPTLKAARSMSVSDICKVFESQTINRSNALHENGINNNPVHRLQNVHSQQQTTSLFNLNVLDKSEHNINASKNKNNFNVATKTSSFGSLSLNPSSVNGQEHQNKNDVLKRVDCLPVGLVRQRKLALCERQNSVNNASDNKSTQNSSTEGIHRIKVCLSNSNKTNGFTTVELESTDDDLKGDTKVITNETVHTFIQESTIETKNRLEELQEMDEGLPSMDWNSDQLNRLIDQAKQSLEDEPASHRNMQFQAIVIQRECVKTGSIGITLAGGVDYENKEITVHKIINGSLAQRDGRICKGDRILSINGQLLKGVTHKKALEIMKCLRPEIVLVIARPDCQRAVNGSSGNSIDNREKLNNQKVHKNDTASDDHSGAVLASELQQIEGEHGLTGLMDNYRIYKANLIKDGAALGFILEGGKDSPLGDRPLAIKRIFKGGPADKEGTLKAGDEIICVNNVAVYCMTRTEAWNHLKKLPDGLVSMVIRRKNVQGD